MTLVLLILSAFHPAHAVRARVSGSDVASVLERPGVSFLEVGRGDWREIDAPEAILTDLEQDGLSVVRLEAPPQVGRDPAVVRAQLLELAAANPQVARAVDLGFSSEGRPITALRLSTTPTPKAHWRVLGAHHGDEPVSATVALAVAESLVELHAQGDAPTVARLAQDAVWVVPVVSPDSLHAGDRMSATGVDLNRNYGVEWSADETFGGPRPFSEPETRAVQAFGVRAPPVLGLSLHAGEANIGWVWNHTTQAAPDEDHLEAIAQSYADACAAPEFWITQGAHWYPTHGDTNDWSYGRQGTFDFTLEVSRDKAPVDEDTVVDWHLPAILELLLTTSRSTVQLEDASGVPLRRRVFDASGKPVPQTLDGTLAGLGDAPVEWRIDGADSTPSDSSWVTERLPPLDGGPRLAQPGLLPPLTPDLTLVPHWGPTDGSGDSPSLPPGIWDATVGGEPVSAALLVDGADAPQVLDVIDGPDGVTVLVAGGGLGMRWALHHGGDAGLEWGSWADADVTGHARLVVPRPNIRQDTAQQVNLVVFGPGGPVWVADVFGHPRWRIHGSAGTGLSDTGQLRAGTHDEARGGGCTAGPVPPGALWWVPLLALSRRRPHP